MITLENQNLSVTIDPFGAQLQSIRSKGREYLWQGDPTVWGKRAPILFPIIARMRDNQYAVDGEIYTLESHGFAKSTTFQVTQTTPYSATFSMTDSEETRKVYPFAFRFSITFTLEDNKIVKRYIVENPATTALYYEVGGHDAFALPFHPGEVMDDCHIRIPGMETVSPYEHDEAVTLLPKSREIAVPGGLMPLKPAVFGLDSILLDAPDCHRAELLDGKGQVRVALEFPAMDYVALWSKALDYDCNFVCIEPWTSLPDAHFVSRELKDKIGVRCVPGGQQETTGYDILLY